MKIGKTTEEIDAGLILECRQIVKNIINFGINERQKIKIMQLLSLELESRDAMNIILEAVKNVEKLDQNVKFSLTSDEEEYNKKVKLIET